MLHYSGENSSILCHLSDGYELMGSRLLKAEYQKAQLERPLERAVLLSTSENSLFFKHNKGSGETEWFDTPQINLLATQLLNTKNSQH